MHKSGRKNLQIKHKSRRKNLHKTKNKCIIYIRGGFMLKRKITKILEEWKKEEGNL